MVHYITDYFSYPNDVELESTFFLILDSSQMLAIFSQLLGVMSSLFFLNKFQVFMKLFFFQLIEREKRMLQFKTVRLEPIIYA